MVKLNHYRVYTIYVQILSYIYIYINKLCYKGNVYLPSYHPIFPFCGAIFPPKIEFNFGKNNSLE